MKWLVKPFMAEGLLRLSYNNQQFLVVKEPEDSQQCP